MNQRTIAIASVLMAAALTGIFTTSPLAYADESETSTDQEVKQKNVGSGNSNNNNCAVNSIDSGGQGGSALDCSGNNLPFESPGGG
jgi:anionic cell wall polymer biosynthesis LytR-Cps2A-Psr (LCP) family protein